MAKTPAKGPGGRPSKYDPAMCARAIECGKEGMTLAEIAADLEIDRSTLAAWQEEKPEFSRAIKAAIDQAQAWWERQGRIATFGGVDGFNATSYIFQMKNRFRDDWADRKEVDHQSSDGTMTPVTRIELVAPGYDDSAG